MTGRARSLPPSNADYDALFWLTSSPTLDVDGGGIIRRANAAACRLLDVGPNDVEGTPLSTLLGVDVMEAVEQGGPADVHAVLPDGPTPLRLRAASRTLAGQDGNDHVVQLTRRLGRDARDADRRSDASRWSLLDDVSHNLGTPLAIVAGYAETLADRWTDLNHEDVAKATDAIRRHARRAVDELQALQARVRLSGGGTGTVPTSVLLAWLRRMLSGPLAANGTVLVGTSDTDVVTLDIEHARQALLNVCQLALSGQPTPLSIELAIRPVPGGTEFVVTTDGGVVDLMDVTIRTTALLAADVGGEYTAPSADAPFHRLWLPTTSGGPTRVRRPQIPVAVIEDDPDTAALIRASLANSSTAFDLVADERTFELGLSAVARTRPRILLLDQGLPDRLGTDGIHELHAAAPGMTVVVLSAEAPPDWHVAGDDETVWLEKGRVLADLGSQLIRVLAASPVAAP